MGYVEQNLMPGEKIVYKASLHWAMFLGPFSYIIWAILLYLIWNSSPSSSSYAFSCSAGIILLAILLIFVMIISYFTTEFALTNKRVIAKRGIIRRRSIEILLSKVESIGVNQPILGRMLDFGTITITGTGGTKEQFPNIASPMELRKRVNNQIATY